MDDDKLKLSARAAFIQYLHSNKLRKTTERYAILDKIFDIAEHFSIESLYEALEKDRFHVSRATVYNTIELLVDCGLLRKHQFDNKSAQFERVPGVSNHHHLICTQCGKIKEVKDAELITILNTRRYSAFHTAYFALYVYGTCSRCLRRNRKKKQDETSKNKKGEEETIRDKKKQKETAKNKKKQYKK